MVSLAMIIDWWIIDSLTIVTSPLWVALFASCIFSNNYKVYSKWLYIFVDFSESVGEAHPCAISPLCIMFGSGGECCSCFERSAQYLPGYLHLPVQLAVWNRPTRLTKLSHSIPLF